MRLSSFAQGTAPCHVPGRVARAKARGRVAVRAAAGFDAGSRSSGRPPPPQYSEYFAPKALTDALEAGTVFKGKIIVSTKNREIAYVAVEGLEIDAIIMGLENQNRAIDDDVVYIQLLPTADWPPIKQEPFGAVPDDSSDSGAELPEAGPPLSFPSGSTVAQANSISNDAVNPRRPSARIVGVAVPSYRRAQFVGFLSPPQGEALPSGKPRSWRLLPSDRRIPACFVDVVPAECQKVAKDGGIEHLLVVGSIERWAAFARNPKARIVRVLGNSGEPDAETAAHVIEHNLIDRPFPESALDCLPSRAGKPAGSKPAGKSAAAAAPTSVELAPSELARRRDRREKRVFTVDSASTRDIDDALGVERLESGNFQISVHIADVTHFVQRDSALDSEARARATSAYFVRGVLPMLPEELSTDLCSLNAGVDRLAFSVECEVDRDGKVLKSWIGRTVMRSAFKMDYNTAQKIIEATEGGTDAPPPPGGLETIFGGHKWEELCQDVADLHSLAQRRRAARKADGAVIMESADLYFDFDDRGHPTGVKMLPQEEANQLVEEFMLLANNIAAETMTSARSAELKAPALLVRNPPPSPSQLRRFSEAGQQLGFGAVETAEEVSRAIARCGDDNPEMGKVLFRVAMPLQRASYFHSGEFPLADWGHYALALGRYTHFTSPIRRFADMTVHRVLGQITDGEVPGGAAKPQEAARQAAAQGPQPDGQGGSVIVAAGKKGKQQMKITIAGVKTVGTAAKPAVHVVSGPAAAALDAEEVASIALHCNDRKRSAKRAQKDNQNFYLFLLLRSTGPRKLRAFATQVGAKGATLFLPDFNYELRVNFDTSGVQGALHRPSRAVVVQRGQWGAAEEGGVPAAAPSAADMVAPAADYSTLEAMIAECPSPSGVDADGMPLPLPVPVVLRVGDVVPVFVQASLQPRRRPELTGALCFQFQEEEGGEEAGAKGGGRLAAQQTAGG